MERWQWQVVEGVYVAAQGEKAAAVARLHRMELLFRKTGHVAAEITATGCRGLVLASIAMNEGEMLAARKVLMRSVYLAQEQTKQQQQAEEEVAAAEAVADKCALVLSLVVVGKELEEAMGWFRLQRAPEMAVHNFRLCQVDKILLGLRTLGRGRRLSGLLIHEAHLQVREAAREVMMMSTSIMDDRNHEPVCGVLSAYERVAEAAMKRQQLSRALDMLREALALGSSSSSVGPFLSIGVHWGWHLWAWSREEAIRYRMGRLLVKLRPGDKTHLAAALAMFANSLQCALRGYATAADEECRLRRANAAWWARLTIQALKGCPPPDFAEAATCSVLEELAGPGRLGWSPISRSQELMECVVEVVEVLVFFPPWQAMVMRHMEAVRALLELMRGTGTSGGSGEDDAWLLFRCTHTLATACRRAGDSHAADRHFMRCRDMGLEQLSAAYALVDAGEVEAAVRRVQQLLSLLTAPPADESSPWPRPKLHAGLLAHAGNLLHLCGHRDAAVVTLSQAWDVLTASGCSLDFITDNHAQQPRYIPSEGETSSHGQQPRDRILMLSEDEMLATGIKRGLSVLIVEYMRSVMRSVEKAAAALELGAALDWYHKAADVARAFPSKHHWEVAFQMSYLAYRIGELQYKAGAWMKSLQMLSDSLRKALLMARDTTADISLWRLLRIEVIGAATPEHVTKACRLVHRVQALLHGRAKVGDGWDLQQDADVIGEIPLSQVQVVLGRALCALSKPEGIRWLEDRIFMLSEDEMLDPGIQRGWSFQIVEYLRSGEEAAAALELDAAVNWYHRAADAARVFPSKQHVAMSHLSYRIGELQFLAGAWMESLEMLSNCLRHVLLAVSDTGICLRTELSRDVLSTARDTADISLWHFLTIEVRGAATPGYVTKAFRLLHRVQALLDGRAQVGDGWDLEQDADVIDEIPVSQVQVVLGRALYALSKPEGIRWLDAVRDALLPEMEMDGTSGRALALAREKFTIHGMNVHHRAMDPALAYSEVAHDSSRAAQMYEMCRDMATHLHNRLSMQLCAAVEWAHAGDLLSAEEAVLEALDFLVPPEQAGSASEVMSMLWGSAAAESSRFRLLASAAWLVETLWPCKPQSKHMHAKLKAALEAVREHCCRSLANNVDYLKEEPILRLMLMPLVDVYQDDKEWAAAEGLLDALAPVPERPATGVPQLKDSRDFKRRKARQLGHTRHHMEAAGVLEGLASEGIHDGPGTGTVAIYYTQLLATSAHEYLCAGQHQLAANMLNCLERKIRDTTRWPPAGPGTNDVDPKQHLEIQLFYARATIAIETGRNDQAVVELQKAASLQEAIISDIHERQLPVAKQLRTLMFLLGREAFLHIREAFLDDHGGFNKDDVIVKGLEARIEGLHTLVQKLDPDAGARYVMYMCILQAWLLLAKGDREKAAEQMREWFLLMAERQEGRGGDDDSWITHYESLAMPVDLLELMNVGLGRNDKALLWAERGRMRLFMHRVHAQQHQEDDPEWAIDSTPNDFDRDDGKALDMLLKVLLACGPNVALIEYSVSRAYNGGRRDLRTYCLFRDHVAGQPNRIQTAGSLRVVPYDQSIEQLVNQARDSIIVTPAAGKKHRLALAKLHSLLVAKVLEYLPDHCDTLIFVPDGCLSLVPFAALYDKSAGQFLIQQKQVVVAPCLRALYRCLDLQDRFFCTASTQLQQPFVAGNPSPMGLGMSQLPHAEEEAAAVADILGVKPCLGAAVTKEAVLKGLAHSSVVVLASHAIVGPKFRAGALVLQRPSLTHDPDMASSSSSRASSSTSAASNNDLALLRAIMMDPDSDEPEAALLMRGLLGAIPSVTERYHDQVLSADELSVMRIRAGLVVLSACDTGRGEVTPEGVLGLGRALLQAGAATTVLSLWKVEDKATKHLITEMFKELQNGEPVGTALRKAMLKMIQEGSSISHWAPFFIFGSPTMHLRNVTTLKAKNKMNGSSPELELGDGVQQVERPTSDATSSASSASSADDQAAVQAVLVGSHESAGLQEPLYATAENGVQQPVLIKSKISVQIT